MGIYGESEYQREINVTLREELNEKERKPKRIKTLQWEDKILREMQRRKQLGGKKPGQE